MEDLEVVSLLEKKSRVLRQLSESNTESQLMPTFVITICTFKQLIS